MALGEEVIAGVLLHSDIEALGRFRSVSKAWGGLIHSSWFRKEWSERHRDEQSSVLLSFSLGDSCGEKMGVRRWLPPNPGIKSEGTLSPYLQFRIPGIGNSKFDIVASSNGLVCACFDVERWRYAVGNPATGEWVHLPLPVTELCLIRTGLTRFSLRAQSSGEFKFQIVDQDTRHYLAVYSSKSRVWKVSEQLGFIPEATFHDLDEGWITVKPPVKFTNLLRNEQNRAHFAEDCIWDITCWNYKGETYLAGGITNTTFCLWPLEHIVWKACVVDKQERTPQAGEGVRSLLWDTRVSEEQVVRKRVFSSEERGNSVMAYHGEGKLCAFAAYIAADERPPGIYDLSSQLWYHLKNFRHDGNLVLCTRAVVYHPSLIKPDGHTNTKRKAAAASGAVHKSSQRQRGGCRAARRC